MNMKKSLKYILFAAAIAVASASCAKEEILQAPELQKELRTFTCSFESDETRTDITSQGKTVWSEGDRLLVTNGTENDTLTVGAASAGTRYFEFQTALEGKIYVVYPVTALDSVSVDGKFHLNLSSTQDGTFGSANIAVAVAEDRYVKMRNVTSVLRFRIPSTVETPIKVVSINAVDDNLAGKFTVDLSSGDPVVSEIEGEEYFTSIAVNVEGTNGNFYVSTIPGTYSAGFSMTAVSLDLANAWETKTTVSDKTLKVNDLVDLGNIGTDLQPVAGSGTEADPYQISNLSEYLAFTYTVNSGSSMAGQAVRLTDNISGVTTPVGFTDDNNSYYFKGTFDGNGKTVTVNINQTDGRQAALFGAVSDSAYIHDVTVQGEVSSTGSNAAGVVGFLYSTSTPVRIVNCVNRANVASGDMQVGGIVGYARNDTGTASNVLLENCSNEGAIYSASQRAGGIAGIVYSPAVLRNCTNSGPVEGELAVGGIAGYLYQAELYDCKNSGTVTSSGNPGIVGHISGGYWRVAYSAGSGGIGGYFQNSTIKRCENSGAVTGYSKTGGITGNIYWGSIISCTNSGNVTATSTAATASTLSNAAAVGGITGWIVVQGLVYDCVNKGDVNASGVGAGGIVGYSNMHGSSNNTQAMQYCTNEGTVTSTSDEVGGIVGATNVMNNQFKCVVDGCINKGAVTANRLVGGMVGSFRRYSHWSRLEITNCENHANIHSTRTNGASDIGGIFGGSYFANCNSQGVMINNAYNTGDVTYANSAITSPRAGGIAGMVAHASNGHIRNVYNSGRVGPKDGTDTTEVTTVGAILGENYQAGSRIQWAYYLEGSCAQAYGTGLRSALGTEEAISAVDASGNLKDAVEISGTSIASLLDALNAWITLNPSGGMYGSNWYRWTAGPGFVYHSYSDPIDGGGFDIGSGGEI